MINEECVYSEQPDCQPRSTQIRIAWKKILKLHDSKGLMKVNEVASGYLEWFQSRKCIQNSEKKNSEIQVTYSAKQLRDYELEIREKDKQIEELKNSLALTQKNQDEAECREQQLIQKCLGLEQENGQKRKRPMEDDTELVKENQKIKENLGRANAHIEQLRDRLSNQKSRVAYWEKQWQDEKTKRDMLRKELTAERQKSEARVKQITEMNQQMGVQGQTIQEHKDQVQELEVSVERLQESLLYEYRHNESNVTTLNQIIRLWNQSHENLKDIRRWIIFIYRKPELAQSLTWPTKMLIEECIKILDRLEMSV